MKLLPVASGVAGGILITAIWGRGVVSAGVAVVVCLWLLLGLGELRPWRPTPATPALPPEYRFAERFGVRLVVMAVPLAILVAGLLLSDSRDAEVATVVLTTVAAVVGVAALMIARQRRQRLIITAVEERAAALDADELRKLVANLEVEHGVLEMRRLRQLVEQPARG